MSFSFPTNPTINQQSTQNGRIYSWNGYSWDLVTNIATHASTHAASGIDPITLTSSQISNFNTSVSGLVNGIYAPITNPSFSGLATFSSGLTSTTGNFTTSITVSNNTINSGTALNIINSSNLYLWSNFR